MASLLSSLVNNLSERIQRIKRKFVHGEKKCERVELNLSIATVFFHI